MISDPCLLVFCPFFLSFPSLLQLLVCSHPSIRQLVLFASCGHDTLLFVFEFCSSHRFEVFWFIERRDFTGNEEWTSFHCHLHPKEVFSCDNNTTHVMKCPVASRGEGNRKKRTLLTFTHSSLLFPHIWCLLKVALFLSTQKKTLCHFSILIVIPLREILRLFTISFFLLSIKWSVTGPLFTFNDIWFIVSFLSPSSFSFFSYYSFSRQPLCLHKRKGKNSTRFSVSKHTLEHNECKQGIVNEYTLEKRWVRVSVPKAEPVSNFSSLAEPL